MSMDGFTASILLDAVVKGGGDNVADLYKSLNSNQDGGPSEEARRFFAQNEGKVCKIKYTTHEGIVLLLNEATGGFYPGSRYPIKVKITNGESSGHVFEYDLEQIEVKHG